MDKISVGKIVKPQGIKGELKVYPMVDTPEIFTFLKKVYIDGVEFKVLSSRVSDAVYVALRGIADRNTAEEYRDKTLYVDREDLPLPEGRWFIADVLGCEVLSDDGNLLGTVTDITTRGSTDMYTVKLKSGKLMVFPFLNDLVLSIDVNKKEIVVSKNRLEEVAYYED